MTNERFNSAQGFRQGKNLGTAQNPDSVFKGISYQVKRDHSAIITHLIFCDLMARMILKTWVVNIFSLGVIKQELGNLFGISFPAQLDSLAPWARIMGGPAPEG